MRLRSALIQQHGKTAETVRVMYLEELKEMHMECVAGEKRERAAQKKRQHLVATYKVSESSVQGKGLAELKQIESNCMLRKAREDKERAEREARISANSAKGAGGGALIGLVLGGPVGMAIGAGIGAAAGHHE